MTLSKNEIEKIDKVLENLGMDFSDLKFEIKDHIACEVEEIMTSKELTFENAFVTTLKKWESDLKSKESWIISNNRTFPNIIVKKLTYRFLIFNSALILTLFFSVFFHKKMHYLIKETPSILNLSIYLSIAFFLCFTILRYEIYKSKIKTSYSFQFNQTFIVFSLFVFSSFFTEGYTYLIIIILPFLIYCYSNHIKFIKIHKLL